MITEAHNNNWFDHRMHDGGPVYMETNPGQLIVEPWNSFSSLLMLLPAFYWLWQIRHDISYYRFLLFAIVMVVLGGIGSALFHGLRASVFFLMMDVIPSAMLTLTLSIYLWLKILRHWWYIIFIVLPAFGVRFLFWKGIPEHMAINISYFISGTLIALPLLIILYKDKFRQWHSVVISVLSFIIALLFRQLDTVTIGFLPMGTHFLWHTFSAIGAFFILKYIHYLRDLNLVRERVYLA